MALTLSRPPDLNDVTDLLEGLVGTVFGGRDEAFELLDEDTIEGVKRGFEAYGVPDLQVAYFPGVDLVAHAAGPEVQREYLREQIGPAIGEVLDSLPRGRRARPDDSTHRV